MTNNPPINPELAKQIDLLSDQVQAFLDGPDGNGQIEGTMPMQRVVLNVPRAFVCLATFLATFNAQANQPNVIWGHEFDEGRDIDRPHARRLMRRRLERALFNAMHDEFQWLASHWFISAPEELLKVASEHEEASTDLDDLIPF